MLKVPNACSLWALEEKIEQLISSNTASLILVFKSLLFYVIIVFLSFRFIHWTQYSPADPSISSLYQLNLRGNAVTQLISAPAARRRRRRSLRRRKRQVPLSSVQLTAAIVLDPFTNSLLVSDASSGNILSCNTTSSPVQCNVAVDSSQLTGAPSGGKHVQFPLFVGHFDIYLQIPCSAHLLCLFIYRCLALNKEVRVDDRLTSICQVNIKMSHKELVLIAHDYLHLVLLLSWLRINSHIALHWTAGLYFSTIECIPIDRVASETNSRVCKRV